MSQYRPADQIKFDAFVAFYCFAGIALVVFAMTMLDRPGPVTQAVRAKIAEVGR